MSRGYPIFDDLHRLGVCNVRRVGVGPEVVRHPHVRSRLDFRGARVHSGAVLTEQQVACFLSHNIAILDSADRTQCQWAVVLEDDARIEESFKDFLNRLEHLSLNRPVIISLFSLGKIVPQHRGLSIKLGNTELVPLSAPPASAVGYAVNLQAVEVIRKFANWPIFTRSDWPPWSGLVKFYIADPFVVNHEEGPSTMFSLPDSPRGLRRLARGVSKLSMASFAAAPDAYGRSISLYTKHSWLPSIRYFANDLQRACLSPLQSFRGWR